LNLRDNDLISIQEARQALERASEAQRKFAQFSQEQIDAVVEACAAAATEAGESLARLAVEETGYGNVPDKIAKNRLASVDVHRAIRGIKTVGILREDREKGIIEIAEPAGVVAAVIPSTNPTSTAIYKTLISIKARNGVVLSPHPSAKRCICEAARVLAEAALKMGAPEGLIQCLQNATIQGTHELMKSRLTGVILATGGTGLVRAAYSSGRPAYGVGPGNVPAMIERTASIRKAVADVFAGKTFDYGTICSSEQSIVTEDVVRDEVLAECRNQGAYFLAPEEIAKLGGMVFRGTSGTPNPQIVGKAATVIAEMAGIKVPAATRVLIARLEGVGRDVPLSGEKLSPILGFYSLPNFSAAVDLCVKLLEHGGLGHTASIHSASEAAVKQYGLRVPAFRIVVNSSAVHGSIGYSTNLFPAMTLGCGSLGGNITSDNIGPLHLMNVKRVAWESRGVEHRTIPAGQRLVSQGAPEESKIEKISAPPSLPEAAKEVPVPSLAPAAALIAQNSPDAGEVPLPDRRTIARIVEQVFEARGIPRGGGQKLPSPEGVAAPAVEKIAPVIAREVVAAYVRKPADERAPEKIEPEATQEPVARADRVSVSELAAAPSVPVADFVCENDVRAAVTRSQKIFVGPKTIVTPAARDLGDAHGVLVITNQNPASHKSSPAEG
jgi:acetaldehyde dehydrogenase (acetylating)